MTTKQPLKIGIIGLGPVGSILAVHFKKAGCQVALCEQHEGKAKKMKEEGIALEGVLPAAEKFDCVHRSISDLKDFDADYLIFSLKTYHTPSAVREAVMLNTEKLMVISAQNGIESEELLAAGFGEDKTMRLVINFAGMQVAPNITRVSFFTPPNYIGSINDMHASRVEEIASVLNSVGMITKPISAFEIVKRSWEKTIMNASISALCGVGRLTMAEAINDPDTALLIEQTIVEAVQVAEKEKINFPDEFVRNCMRYLKKGGDHFPSLALDLINNRPTEIDYFNGKIVEYGKKHYVRTSLNLSFTNMVKAMTNKNIALRIPGAAGEVNKRILEKGLVIKNKSHDAGSSGDYFMGIDLGSAYTKFSVIDDRGNSVFRYCLPTLNSDKQAKRNVLQAISSAFKIRQSCATGYGRKHFEETDLVKTEINCASAAISHFFHGEKNIIDIGGEDIKIIRCGTDDAILNFFMNDKCAAGTGAFITEIGERANINIAEMSGLASLSGYDKELNSFCTVFAKTEIMNWIFDGMKPEDISRGIYLSIANKVAKMRLDPGIPNYMIGGVIAYHPFLKTLLSEKFNKDIRIADHPQYTVSYGAALLAMNQFKVQRSKFKENTVNLEL